MYDQNYCPFSWHLGTPPFYMWKIQILYHNLVQKSQLFFKFKLVYSNFFEKNCFPPSSTLIWCPSTFYRFSFPPLQNSFFFGSDLWPCQIMFSLTPRCAWSKAATVASWAWQNKQIWANYKNSQTWNKAILGWFHMIPLINHHSSEVVVRSL